MTAPAPGAFDCRCSHPIYKHRLRKGKAPGTSIRAGCTAKMQDGSCLCKVYQRAGGGS